MRTAPTPTQGTDDRPESHVLAARILAIWAKHDQVGEIARQLEPDDLQALAWCALGALDVPSRYDAGDIIPAQLDVVYGADGRVWDRVKDDENDPTGDWQLTVPEPDMLTDFGPVTDAPVTPPAQVVDFCSAPPPNSAATVFGIPVPHIETAAHTAVQAMEHVMDRRGQGLGVDERSMSLLRAAVRMVDRIEYGLKHPGRYHEVAGN